MKVVGIIVEYNPLHNGHLHHINETRRLSKCDCLVAVMSSNFTQRGEPALVDKFIRTEMALKNGIDLVVELPFVFGVQNADIFALTSVSILNILGVDEIYFGSETGNIEELEKIGDIMQGTKYNSLVKKYMDEGNSYPTSGDKAMKQLSNTTLFDLPNSILGIHYILAGKKLNSNITFKTIKRLSTNYFDEIDNTSHIQSATSIRKLIKNKEDFSEYVPNNVYESLKNTKTIDYEDFYNQIAYTLKSKSALELREIFNIKEGIENRILKTKKFSSVQDLINKLLTRRYTNSKIKRILAHILCNTKHDLIDSFEIPYIRILGMNESGQALLNDIKKEINIPLITKAKEGIHKYLDMEIRVSRIYEIAANNGVYTKEFQPLIYVHFN